jgi:cobalt-zinc-cadmium efflux system outer membrane protein
MFTIDQLVTLALERNRDLLAARERLTEAQGLLRQAGVRLAPTIESEGTTGRPVGTQGEEEFSAAFFYPIETGGKRQKRVKVAEFGPLLAEAEVAERTRQLTFEIKRRAVEVLAANRKQEAVERLLGLGRESYQVTKARVDEGDAAPLEQQLLSTELARVEVQQASFAGRVASALLELRQIVDTDGDSFAVRDEVTPPSRDLSLEKLRATAEVSRPDLHALQLLEHQATAEAELARVQGRPDVTASARYTHRNSFFDEYSVLSPAGSAIQLRDHDNVLSFGVSIPLFTQRRNQGNVEAAVARERATRLRREYLERTVPLEVEAAYNRWAAAQRALSLFQRGVIEQSEKNLAVIRESYTLGQLRVLDVLAEQRRLIDTQLAYIDAQSELALATAELERSVGGKL